MSNRHGAVATSPTLKKHKIAVEAPDARSVVVTGSFCGWVAEGFPLKKGRKGVWEGTLALPPGRYEYRLLVDGEWRDDPACRERVPNGFGTENCVLEL
jgi:1,4-alpha-glucan branching enzyme